MYQFTTTNVINSAYAVDYDGNALLDSTGTAVNKYTGSATGLNVAKVGNFKIGNIVSIYKRPYTASVKEVAKVTIPAITSGLTARLSVNLKLNVSANSEYANYALDFQKPIVVEVLSTGTDSTTCDALVIQLNGLKDRFGYRYFTAVKVNTADVQITCRQPEQRVSAMVISKSAASYTSTMLPEYEDVSSTTFSVTTAGKIGFGDDAWMARRVTLPTAENVRAFGISKEERPIIGGNYSEYVLRYSLTKDGTDGILGGETSITTHVFYVLSTLVPYFEAAIFAAGKGIISVDSDQAFTLALTGDTTATVAVVISAIVPFILSSAEITATSATVAKATIGAITVATPTGTPPVQTAGIVLTKQATGTTVISVTIDGVTKTITATIG